MCKLIFENCFDTARYGLQLENAERVEHRRNKDQHDTDRCDVFDDYGKHFLALELDAVALHLGNNRLRLNEIADENTGAKRHDRHENAVGDEIEEIKELHADDFDKAEKSVAGRRQEAENDREAQNDKAGRNAFHPEFIADDRDHRLH